MLCSPPPATTLASSCAGSEGFCAPCCRRSSQRSRIHNRPKTGRALLLHERLPILNRNLLLHGVSFEAMTATHFVVLAGSRMPGVARSGFQPNVIYAWKIMKWNGDALGLQMDSCAEALAPYTVLMHAAIDAVKRSGIPSASRVHFLTSNPDVNRLLNQDRSIRRKN